MPDLILTTNELVRASRGLPLIAGADVTARGAYVLRRARAAVTAAMAIFEATRVALAAKHSHQDAGGGPRKKIVDVKGIPTEVFDIADQAAYDAAIAEILSEPVTLSGVRAITIAELGSASISELALTLLGPLVADEELTA